MKIEKISNKIITIAFLLVIFFFMTTIFGQFVIKNVLIEKLNMDNFITDWSVTGGSDGMISVDWESMYPFEEQPSMDEKLVDTPYVKEPSVLSKMLDKTRGLIDLIDKYCNDYLSFKEPLKAPSGYFDEIIGNKMVDANNIYIRTKEGGLIVRSPFKTDYTQAQTDMSNIVASFVELRDYLKESDIELMYVQAPVKEDMTDTEYVAKYGLSLENTLANNLLEGLEAEGIPTMDIRGLIGEAGKKCYDQFFVSDNHWNIDAAFWASKELAKRLNKDFGYEFDMSLYDKTAYERVTYYDWVQGTVGRSVTLARAGYDDINIFYPKFDTNLTMVVPNLRLDITGSFKETMINPVPFKSRSTVYRGAYDAFAYSKPPLTQITNNISSCNQGKKILFLRESFAGPVIPYIAVGIEKLDAITPESFTGSIRTYIEETKPDMVVVLYAAPTTTDVTIKYSFR